MGQTLPGDTPGGGHFIAGPFTQASLASNAQATIRAWRAPGPCKLVNAVWTATEGDQTAHATNHRVISVLDGGTAAAGTAEMTSKAFTASLASDTPTTIATTADLTLDAGDIVVVTYASTNTASSVGKLYAGELFLTFKYA